MRFLVTGGAGYVGSNLVDSFLADGHQCIVVDNLSKKYRLQTDRAHSVKELVTRRDRSAGTDQFWAYRPQPMMASPATMCCSAKRKRAFL